MGKLLQDAFEKPKPSFISAYSICMTVPCNDSMWCELKKENMQQNWVGIYLQKTKVKMIKSLT